jgi:hypothetical protein
MPFLSDKQINTRHSINSPTDSQAQDKKASVQRLLLARTPDFAAAGKLG